MMDKVLGVAWVIGGLMVFVGGLWQEDRSGPLLGALAIGLGFHLINHKGRSH